MRRIKKLLFPTHFKHLSYSSLEKVLTLKEAGLLEVIFLHVMDRDEVGYVPFGGFDKELAHEMKEKAILTFQSWGKRLDEESVSWRELVEIGDPEPKIIEVSKRENVDMIVVGRHATMADSIYPGGVEMGIVRDSGVPVLMLPHKSEKDHDQEEALFEHVLSAVDFSDASSKALKMIQELGPAVKRVSILHVVDPDEVSDLTETEMDSFNKNEMAKLDGISAIFDHGAQKLEKHLLSGSVVEEVTTFATEHSCTLVALGTKGRRGIMELIHGSVSHKVAMTIDLPVLIVP